MTFDPTWFAILLGCCVTIISLVGNPRLREAVRCGGLLAIRHIFSVPIFIFAKVVQMFLFLSGAVAYLWNLGFGVTSPTARELNDLHRQIQEEERKKRPN